MKIRCSVEEKSKLNVLQDFLYHVVAIFCLHCLSFPLNFWRWPLLRADYHSWKNRKARSHFGMTGVQMSFILSVNRV